MREIWIHGDGQDCRVKERYWKALVKASHSEPVGENTTENNGNWASRIVMRFTGQQVDRDGPSRKRYQFVSIL
jgi:hypothetical protein